MLHVSKELAFFLYFIKFYVERLKKYLTDNCTDWFSHCWYLFNIGKFLLFRIVVILPTSSKMKNHRNHIVYDSLIAWLKYSVFLDLLTVETILSTTQCTPWMQSCKLTKFISLVMLPYYIAKKQILSRRNLGISSSSNAYFHYFFKKLLQHYSVITFYMVIIIFLFA